MTATATAGHVADRAFFARDSLSVARDLVGAALLLDEGAVVARIVEVEAYGGEDDAASHAFRGRTPRAAIMFGPPGHLYVYLSYGIHQCANIVTNADGVAGAVLLRAATVEQGETQVRQRRHAPTLPGEHLLRGPGNLCAGLGIGAADNGRDLCLLGDRLRLMTAPVTPPIESGPRIGITRAAELPYRFWWPGRGAVSAWRGAATSPSVTGA